MTNKNQDSGAKHSTVAINLSKAFSSILREWLTPTEIDEINQMNSAETDGDACNTHEFCDPNQAMIDAFEKVMGREIDFQSDADAELMNTAWNISKRSLFTDAEHTEYKGHVITVLPQSHCASIYEGNTLKGMATGDIAADGSHNAVEKAKIKIDNFKN